MAILEMSLSEALNKKKVLEGRINKFISDVSSSRSVSFVDCTVGESGIIRNTNIPISDYKRAVESNLKSINTLIDNYTALCKAINKKNNETMVTIAGKEMSIVEAIALKSNNIFNLKTTLANKIMSDYTKAITTAEKYNNDILDEEKINNYLTTVLSKEELTNTDTVKKIEDQYRKSRSCSTVDPLNGYELAKELRTEAEDFSSEVDFKLSEINAVTKITVEFKD